MCCLCFLASYSLLSAQGVLQLYLASLQQACKLMYPAAPDATCCCLWPQVWLDHDNVLLGSKCNKLTRLHLPSLTCEDIPYPPQPVHRSGRRVIASRRRLLIAKEHRFCFSVCQHMLNILVLDHISAFLNQ